MAKILVIADSSGSCNALPRGLELAHKLGYSVDVVAFCYSTFKPLKIKGINRSDIKKRLMAKREAEVQQFIERYEKSDQKVTLKIVWEKDEADWIVKRSTRAYDLVVKTGERVDGFAFTSADWRLLRECSRSLLFVSSKKWQRTKPIMAAVDLASNVPEKVALNHKIIERAKALAAVLKTDLHIIAAIEIPELLMDLDLIDPLAYTKEVKREMKPRLQKLAAAHDLSEKIFRMKRGPVDKVISSEAAKCRAQLVVMGTVGKPGIARRLLGNTAEKVLRHLRTDVLAVKV
ncbi:MAG: universal stress protein E [Halioglobus sp.]|jgi:universal stress protein E